MPPSKKTCLTGLPAPVFRRIFLDRLKEIGKSGYWLSNTQTSVTAGSFRHFLYSERPVPARAIEECCGILGLVLVPAENVPVDQLPKEEIKS